MEYAKITKEMKRQQEKDFLDHIAQIEEMEKLRKDNGRKAINSDFISSNNLMQQQNAAKKRAMEDAQRNDKYNYFPFISGDLIEKHRAHLGAQLKNDLQSYLDYSKHSKVTSPQALSSFDKNKMEADIAHARSNVSTVSTTNRKQHVLKNLFDSEYVKPEENFRVL